MEKKDFEEYISKNIKINNKQVFEYTRSKTLSRETIGPLDDNGNKGVLKEKAIAEKFN